MTNQRLVLSSRWDLGTLKGREVYDSYLLHRDSSIFLELAWTCASVSPATWSPSAAPSRESAMCSSLLAHGVKLWWSMWKHTGTLLITL